MDITILNNSTMNIYFVHIQGTELWKELSQQEKKDMLINIYEFYNPGKKIPYWLSNIVNKSYKIFPELILPLRD